MLRVLLFSEDKDLIQAIRSELPDYYAQQLNVSQDFNQVSASVKAADIDIIFIDFQLPDMGGFRILQVIRATQVQIKTIVFSQDLDTPTREMIITLGGFEALPKPTTKADLQSLFANINLTQNNEIPTLSTNPLLKIYREISETAFQDSLKPMSEASKVQHLLVSDNVNYLEPCSYLMLLEQIKDDDVPACFCKSFYGAGIAGEVFNLFTARSLDTFQKLFPEFESLTQKLECLAQLTNACFLKYFAQQIDTPFQGLRQTLITPTQIQEIHTKNKSRWQESLIFESEYVIPALDLTLYSLYFFSEKSAQTLQHKVDHLLEE